MPDPERRVHARIDLHCHSAFSKDALGDLDAIARAARAKGLDGVCLTEHDTVAHHDALEAWNDAQGDLFRFFPGCEVSARGGHILSVGATSEIPLGRSVLETITRIHDEGGVAVPAHPLRRGSGIGLAALEEVRDELHVVEVWNAQELGDGNRRAASWCVAQGLGGTGGSDCHQVHDVGNGYTEFMEPVRDPVELVTRLTDGESWGVGRKTSPLTLARQASRNLVRRATGRL